MRANSYFIRKGLSRKAQLSYYLKKFTSKNPKSILRRAVPESLVIDTWEAFEDKMNFGALGGARYLIKQRNLCFQLEMHIMPYGS